MDKIKKVPVEDMKQFVDISRNAYPAMNINTEDEIHKAIERFSKLQDEHELANIYGLYRNEGLVGGMMLYDFKMKFMSATIDVGGVGTVGVNLLHKKEKVAKELITYFLSHYKERGIYLALLYPFRPDFYKQMGFGYGTKMNQYRVKPSSLPKGPSKSAITFLEEKDKEKIGECYKRYISNKHGMIEKSQWDLDSMFKNSQNRIVGCLDKEQATGYAVFSFKAASSDNFLLNDIYIKEFIYNDINALTQLLTFFNSQSDQIRYIVFNTQDEHFHYLLSDPTNGSNNVLPHVYHESNTQGVGLMYRVIDIPGIFTTLSNHSFGEESCKLKITVRDTFLKENEGSTIVNFNKGKASIGDRDFDVEIAMDISDFSSMIVGAVSFKSLYSYGIASISDESYLNTVNKLFLVEEKPFCITGF